MRLKDMVCIVTGANGGTGPAIVGQLGQHCAAVVGVTRGVEVEWRELGSKHYEVTADVLSQTSIGFLVSEVLRHLDAFHVWINVVGGFIRGKAVEETDSEHWPKMFDLNFISTLNCCKKILPIFKSQSFGRIINFGSVAGLQGMALAAPYAVSKAAVINLTQTLAQEGRAFGITANVIVPSIIDTPANRKAMPNEDFSKWTKPETVARRIVGVIDSDRTGEIILV